MFELALALGRTVAELEQTMTASEFTEWAFIHGKAPIGALRDDYRAGIIVSSIAQFFAGASINPLEYFQTFYEWQKDEPEGEISVEEWQEFFGANVVKLGKKPDGSAG